MERKKKWLAAGILLVIVFLCRAAYLGQTVPLIECDEKSRITRVVVYWEKWPKGWEDVTERIDGDKVLELLEARQRKRGRSGKKSYITIDNDTRIEIRGEDKNGEFEIFVGKWHKFCRNASRRQVNYWILEEDALREEVFALIDGEAEGGGGHGEQKEMDLD